MEWLLFVATILYIGQIVFARVGWKKVAATEHVTLPEAPQPITLIIPFRNEEEHVESLFNDLYRQRYQGKFEVIWVNDHSDDSSLNRLEQLLLNSHNHRLISLINSEGKKAALALGIAESIAPVIVTIDADVRLPENWLSAIACEMETGDHDMLILPVDLVWTKKKFLMHFQGAEHLAIQALSFGWAGWNRPISCNGANLAFRRLAFEQVGGYQAHDDIASGDDILLLQSFLREQKKVTPLLSHQAMVKTCAAKSWRKFLNQRLRWSGKSGKMTHRWARISGGILMLHAVLWWIAAATCTVSVTILFLVFFLRVFADVVLIKSVESWYNKRMNLLKLVVISMLYIAYLPLVYVGSTFVKPTWKGRKIE